MEVSKYTLQVACVAKRSIGKLSERTKAINELYMKMYGMDKPFLDGVYHMVSRAFKQCWESRGQHYQHFLNVMDDSLPEHVWRVGGKMYKKGARFNSKQILEAQILAMLSYIRLTEIRYLPGYPPNEDEDSV